MAGGGGDFFDDDLYYLPDEAYINNRKRHRGHDDDEDESFRFSPPLYKQRYNIVIEELKNNLDVIDKMADFGCAEGKFLSRVRDRLGNTVGTFVGVDIDSVVLQGAQTELESCQLEADAFETRPPCVTYLFKGSIGEYDDRLADMDAVVAIELIEHLYDDVLRAAVETIFSRLRPYLVIFTTPNVEFNVLFNMRERRFRHDDHKFEWTRKEFETWCNSIVTKHPRYKVRFTGVGTGPQGYDEKIGYASQMAVFCWRNSKKYFDLKESRLRVQNLAVKQNGSAYVEHMKGSEAVNFSADGQEHKHPYQMISKIVPPTEIYHRKRRRLAAVECRDYARDLYRERQDQFKKEPTRTDLIDTDPETGVKGIWIDLEDLFKLPLVKEFCEKPSEVAWLLHDEECFQMDGGGFFFECQRVMFMDEDDLMNYRYLQERNDDDEDEEFDYDNNPEYMDTANEGDEAVFPAEVSEVNITETAAVDV